MQGLVQDPVALGPLAVSCVREARRQDEQDVHVLPAGLGWMTLCCVY